MMKANKLQSHTHSPMKKIALGLVFLAVPLLSGCSLPGGLGGGSSAPSVSLLRSNDGGSTFVSKSALDEKTNFGAADIVSMVFSPTDTRHIFLGTKDSGMFASDNSGDSWRKVKYPPTKTYGLVIDVNNPSHLFATGVWQGRGKIYQSTDTGENWAEVYTEPANGTVITALVQDPSNSQIVYAGTSAGAIIRTNDGGATWKNMTFAPVMNGHIIWNITFDRHRSGTMYFLVDGLGIFVVEGEKIVTEPGSASSLPIMSSDTKSSVSAAGAISLALDPSRSGVLYAGTSKGLLRSGDFGKTWEELNIIESSKKFPIKAIAVNPRNSSEIVYVAALTLYKSDDAGVHWSTSAISSDKAASFIRYDSYDPSIMYIGFKN